jgi:hypothetical protein
VLDGDGTPLTALWACRRTSDTLPYRTSGRQLRLQSLLVEGASVQVTRGPKLISRILPRRPPKIPVPFTIPTYHRATLHSRKNQQLDQREASASAATAWTDPGGRRFVGALICCSSGPIAARTGPESQVRNGTALPRHAGQGFPADGAMPDRLHGPPAGTGGLMMCSVPSTMALDPAASHRVT